MLKSLVLPSVSMLLGSLITILVSRYYYKRSSSDLRWEARAGTIPQSTLDLLVAYVDWGQDLRTDQGISLGDSGHMPNCGVLTYKYVLHLLRDAGLAGVGLHAFGRQVDSEDKGPIPPTYQTLFVTEEGKGLATYIKKVRGVDCCVVELFRMTSDKGACRPLECLWTIVPGKKPGPILEYYKHDD